MISNNQIEQSLKEDTVSGPQKSTKDATDAIKENARIGYQVAVDLLTHEGDLNWARFNAMVVANSIIMAGIVLVLTSENIKSILPVFTFGLPIVGLVLCILWFFLANRAFKYERYWILSARELEEQYLADSVKTISRGSSFVEKKEGVTLNISGDCVPIRMGTLTRYARVRYVCYFIIIVFAILYIIMFFQIFWERCIN